MVRCLNLVCSQACSDCLILFGWAFYGVSTIVGYLMPNPVFTYILNIYDLQTHFVDTHSKIIKQFIF